jgi:RHS repeat-associated protein
MTSAVQGGVTSTYAVNALGQRVGKTSGGVTTLFAYDEAGHLIGEYSGTGALQQETVWFGDTPVATLRPNGSGGINIYYVHTDHLNTPRRITRPSDNVVIWQWNSDPFGNGFVDQDPDADAQMFVYNLRFPGQYYDAETGLSQNYFRDYDPQVGRYVESDPIGLKGGINTYTYVDDGSTRFVDSRGLVRQDPSSPYCQDLAAKIERIRKRIETRRYKELEEDKWTLPQRLGPGESLRDTVRGHQTLINIESQNLRRLEDKYDDDCTGQCKICTAGATAVAGAAALGAGYVAYRCLRLLPSLAPPLWFTLPANLAAP